MKSVRLSGDVKAHAKALDTRPGAQEDRLGDVKAPLEPWKLFRSHRNSSGEWRLSLEFLGLILEP
jgi:hypothetical protein